MSVATGYKQKAVELICEACGIVMHRCGAARFCFDCSAERQRTKAARFKKHWVAFMKTDGVWKAAPMDTFGPNHSFIEGWVNDDPANRCLRMVLLPA